MHVSTIPSPSLIISVADNADALNLVLSSLARQTFQPRAVIVADESRDDQCVGVIQFWTEKLGCPLSRISSAGIPSSRAPLLNRAIRDATGDYLIFIEGDYLLHRRFIADHVELAVAGKFVQGRRAGVRARYVRRISLNRFYPTLWMLSRRVYGLKRAIRRPWPIIRVNDLRSVHGCNFAAWRSDLVRVNGFDENFDDVGDEIVELAARLRNAGLTLNTITGRAIVFHLDHHHLARYRSVKSSRILERTVTENLTQCEIGLVKLPASTLASEHTASLQSESVLPELVSPAVQDQTGQPEIAAAAPSHFRDKIVPRSMLNRFVHRSL